MADENKVHLSTYTPRADEKGLLESGNGLFFRAEARGPDELFLSSETERFAKWIKLTHPELRVEVEKGRTLALHSGDIWLPFAVLGSDVAVHLYIDLVAHYLYDLLKGTLQHDKKTVHLTIVSNDAMGAAKQLNYEGPVEGLKACFDKININDLFNGD